MSAILHELRNRLSDLGNEATRKATQKFFKEEIRTYGLKVPAVKALAKPFLDALKPEKKAVIFDTCEDLWQSGYQEEAIIACNLSLTQKKRFESADIEMFEHWISNYVSNWASCDTLCNHTVGELLLKFPALLPRLQAWAVHPNRWMRRAAAVSLIVPARRGKFLPEILRVACIELEDPDDMVQKGYGWALKSAAEVHVDAVFNFVMEHRRRMPRTALRYAIEKMPADLKRRAMEK